MHTTEMVGFEPKNLHSGQCHKMDASSRILSKHYKQKHSGNNCTYRCCQCKLNFGTKAALQRHKNRVVHTGIECHYCKASFARMSSLTAHIRHTHLEKRRFKCNECSKTFTRMESLRVHLLAIHSEVKPHQCQFCGKHFGQKGNLLSHLRVHTGEKPFACQVCGKGFSQSNAMRDHLRRHTGEKPYKCKTESCVAAFSDNGSLRKHVKACHEISTAIFKCSYCPREFKLAQYLRRHVTVTHENKRPFICSLCPSAFKQKSHLIKHMTNVHAAESADPHVCDHCGRTFKHQGHLTNHIRAQHSKKVACKRKRTQVKLQLDMVSRRKDKQQTIHTGPNCNQCGEVILDIKGLKTHGCKVTGIKSSVSTIHKLSDDRPKKTVNKKHNEKIANEVKLPVDLSTRADKMETTIRNEADVSNQNALIPSNSSTRSFPDECRDCRTNFATKRSLSCNLRRVHTTMEESHHCVEDHSRIHMTNKSHTCNECGKDFSLLKHMKNHVCLLTGSKYLKPTMSKNDCAFPDKDNVSERHKPFNNGDSFHRCEVSCKKLFVMKHCLQTHNQKHLPVNEKSTSAIITPGNISDCKSIKNNEKLSIDLKKTVKKLAKVKVDSTAEPGDSLKTKPKDRSCNHALSKCLPGARICKLCNATFENVGCLISHNIMMHHKKGRLRRKNLLLQPKPFLKDSKNMHKKEVSHICKECGNSFKHPLHLKLHINDHHRSKKLPADRKFHKTVSSIEELQLPRNNLQTAEMPTDIHGRHICVYCNVPFKYISSLKRHIKMIHSNALNIGKTVLLSESPSVKIEHDDNLQVERSQNIHSETQVIELKPNQPDPMNSIFVGEAGSLINELNDPEVIKSGNLNDCMYFYSNNNNSEKLLIDFTTDVHEQEKLSSGQQFSSPINLPDSSKTLPQDNHCNHILNKCQTGTHKCKRCVATFEKVGCLISHSIAKHLKKKRCRRKIHNSLLKPKTKSSKYKKEVLKLHICKKCGSSFMQPWVLKRHKCNVHHIPEKFAKEGVSQKPENDVKEQPKANTGIEELQLPKDNLQTVEMAAAIHGKHICVYCNKSFKYISSLKRHMKMCDSNAVEICRTASIASNFVDGKIKHANNLQTHATHKYVTKVDARLRIQSQSKVVEMESDQSGPFQEYGMNSITVVEADNCTNDTVCQTHLPSSKLNNPEVNAGVTDDFLSIYSNDIKKKHSNSCRTEVQKQKKLSADEQFDSLVGLPDRLKEFPPGNRCSMLNKFRWKNHVSMFPRDSYNIDKNEDHRGSEKPAIQTTVQKTGKSVTELLLPNKQKGTAGICLLCDVMFKYTSTLKRHLKVIHNLPDVNKTGSSMSQPVSGKIQLNDNLKIHSTGEWREVNSHQPTQLEVDCNLPTQLGVVSNQPSQLGIVSNQPTQLGIVSNQPTQLGIVSNQPTQLGIVSNQSAQLGIVSSQPTHLGVVSSQPTQLGIIGNQSTVLGIISNQPTQLGIISNQPTQMGIISNQPTQLEVVSNQPTQMGIISNQPTELGIVSNQSAQLGIIGNQPTQLGIIGNQPTQLGIIGNQSTVLGIISNQPTQLGIISNQPTQMGIISNQPTQLGVVSNQPTQMGIISNQPTELGIISNQPIQLKCEVFEAESDQSAEEADVSHYGLAPFDFSGGELTHVANLTNCRLVPQDDRIAVNGRESFNSKQSIDNCLSTDHAPNQTIANICFKIITCSQITLYQCAYCPAKFVNTPELLTHVKEQHRKACIGNEIASNTECLQNYDAPTVSDGAELVYSVKNGWFQCEHCGAEFVKDEHLSIHTKVLHSDLMTDNKSLCCTVMENDRFLLEDQNQVPNPLADNIATKNETPKIGWFQCEYCGAEFVKDEHLSIHTKVLHSDLMTDNKSCTIMENDRFLLVDQNQVPNPLADNIATKDETPKIGVFQCKYCDAKFMECRKFLGHIEEQHGNK